MTADARIEFRTVAIDCSDAHTMAAFYGRLLGWEPTFSEPDWVLMRNPAGGVGLSFQAEPTYRPPVWPQDPDQQLMMMHLDLRVDDLEGATARALAAGGRLAEHQPRDDLRVILDPAGHPLCLFLD